MRFSIKTTLNIKKELGDGFKIIVLRSNRLYFDLEVPHAHFHLIPINKKSDVHFSNPKNLAIKNLKPLQKKLRFEKFKFGCLITLNESKAHLYKKNTPKNNLKGDFRIK